MANWRKRSTPWRVVVKDGTTRFERRFEFQQAARRYWDFLVREWLPQIREWPSSPTVDNDGHDFVVRAPDGRVLLSIEIYLA